MAVEITSTLPSSVAVGEPVSFQICTVADGELGTNVIALITLAHPYQSAQFTLTYFPPVGSPEIIKFNAEGQAIFGPLTGFPLANTCSNFEITFFATGAYAFTIQIINFATGAVLATLNSNVQVAQVSVLACYLSDAYGNPVTPQSPGGITCEEVPLSETRTEQNVAISNGTTTTLQSIVILIKGYVTILLNNGTSSTVPFQQYQQFLICAPNGTTVTCSIATFECSVQDIFMNGTLEAFLITINICLEVISTEKAIVCVLSGYCTPRQNIVNTCPLPEPSAQTSRQVQISSQVSQPQVEEQAILAPIIYDWVITPITLRISAPYCGALSCNWIEYPNNPVYNPPTSAYYETVRYSANGFAPYGVFAYYKMWYDYSGSGGIALATSPDGIHWTFNTFSTGLNARARHSRVLFDPDGFGMGTPYRIWYWNSQFINFSACGSATIICMIRTASSLDGVHWSSDTTISQNPAYPLFATTGYNSGSFGPADILYFADNPPVLDLTAPFNNRYVMYYDVVYTDNPSGIHFEQIALAVSTDGYNWSKVGPDVVLPHGSPTSWDYYYATVGAVVVRLAPNNFMMWYSGGHEQSYQGIGCATSTDGIHWTKYAGNPIFSVFQDVPWRNMRTYNPWVLVDFLQFSGHGDPVCFKFWMTGAPAPTDKTSIGYATNQTAPINLP